MESNPVAERFVGIDVSKSWVDVHVRPDGLSVSLRYRAAKDLAGLARRCGRWRRCLVVMEASGGYEGMSPVELTEAGLPVARQSAPGPQVRRASGDWPRPTRSMRR